MDETPFLDATPQNRLIRLFDVDRLEVAGDGSIDLRGLSPWRARHVAYEPALQYNRARTSDASDGSWLGDR